MKHVAPLATSSELSCTTSARSSAKLAPSVRRPRTRSSRSGALPRSAATTPLAETCCLYQAWGCRAKSSRCRHSSLPWARATSAARRLVVQLPVRVYFAFENTSERHRRGCRAASRHARATHAAAHSVAVSPRWKDKTSSITGTGSVSAKLNCSAGPAASRLETAAAVADIVARGNGSASRADSPDLAALCARRLCLCADHAHMPHQRRARRTMRERDCICIWHCDCCRGSLSPPPRRPTPTLLHTGTARSTAPGRQAPWERGSHRCLWRRSKSSCGIWCTAT